MIPFFRYTKPIWNLNLNQKSNNLFELNDVPAELSSFIDKNINYDNDGLIKLDISYQLWSNGYIVKNNNEPFTIDQSDISLNDNYKLLARFSKKRWLFATWVLRILELNNPYNETLALINNLSVKKLDSSNLRKELKQRIEKKWDKFRLSVNISNSLVSVIIPTLNRYNHLKKVLHDLEKQSYKNFEVIIIDQSDSYNEKFYKGWDLKIKYFKQNEKALWLARNNAIKASTGSFILLTEDDVRFKKLYLKSLKSNRLF